MKTPGKSFFSLLSLNSLQDVFSVGYLYLLLLGILSDSIYYGLLGINITSYSGVLDILLSPLSYLTKNLVFPLMILVIPALVILLVHRTQSRVKKELESKTNFSEKDKHDLNVKLKTLGIIKIVLPFIAILSAYIGYAFGGGEALRDRLQSGNYSLTHKITYRTGDSDKVKMIGKNSSYLFYVIEGQKTVSVSPISGNIKTIDVLDE